MYNNNNCKKIINENVKNSLPPKTLLVSVRKMVNY